MRIKQRMVCGIIALVMCISCLPFQVFASETQPSDISPQSIENYDLWVGPTQVTSDNANDILSDGTVTYDGASNTLTLNNATINTAYDMYGSKLGIYARNNLNINLVGTNSITSSDAGMYSSYGIECGGTLVITSSTGGSLTVMSDVGLPRSMGIDSYGDISIKGGTITAIGGSADDESYGVSSSGEIRIIGGTLIAKAVSAGETTSALNKAPVFTDGIKNYSYEYSTTEGGAVYTRGADTPFTNDGNPIYVKIQPCAESVGGEKIDVQAIALNDTVYSVDVEWGTMTFKYENTWNPETHTNGGLWKVYDTGENSAISSTQDDTNMITVTNHSNASVYATFEYTPDTSGTNYSDTTGGFSKLDTDSQTSFTEAVLGGLPAYITLATSDNVVGGTGIPTVGNVYFMPTGIGASVATGGIADWTTIGKITVGVQTSQPE